MEFNNFGIETFYRYLVKNSKIIILFLIVLVIHFVFVAQLQEKAFIVEDKLELRKIHQIAQVRISKNLMGTCELFRIDTFQSKLRQDLLKIGYNYNFYRKKILKIEKLIFYELNFNSFEVKNSSISTNSVGYLVEHEDSKNCFGVI